MPMSKVSEFVTFLSNRDHPLNEILAHLVRVTFRDLNCESVLLFELNEKNEFITVDISGASEVSVNEIAEKYSLSDHYPISDALKYDRIIFISSVEEFVQEYPLLVNFPVLLSNSAFFAVPISLSGTPVAAFAIFCKENSALHNTDLDFLKVITDIFAFSVYANRDSGSINRKVELDIPHITATDSENLSLRQVLISRLISEGRTNHDISELIGYSESTVRQEIMKVFVLTNSNSRRQVGEHYRSTHPET